MGYFYTYMTDIHSPLTPIKSNFGAGTFIKKVKTMGVASMGNSDVC